MNRKTDKNRGRSAQKSLWHAVREHVRYTGQPVSAWRGDVERTLRLMSEEVALNVTAALEEQDSDCSSVLMVDEDFRAFYIRTEIGGPLGVKMHLAEDDTSVMTVTSSITQESDLLRRVYQQLDPKFVTWGLCIPGVSGAGLTRLLVSVSAAIGHEQRWGVGSLSLLSKSEWVEVAQGSGPLGESPHTSERFFDITDIRYINSALARCAGIFGPEGLEVSQVAMP